MTAGLFFCPESQKIRDHDSFILIPDNASWYTAIHFESLIKASYKIVKRLFCLNYILQKYHRSVSNVAMVLIVSLCKINKASYQDIKTPSTLCFY